MRMRKLQDFSVIYILRKINFGVCRSYKTDIFAILRALTFAYLVNFSVQKVQKIIQIKIQSLLMCSNGRFSTSRIPKMISRKI